MQRPRRPLRHRRCCQTSSPRRPQLQSATSGPRAAERAHRRARPAHGRRRVPRPPSEAAARRRRRRREGLRYRPRPARATALNHQPHPQSSQPSGATSKSKADQRRTWEPSTTPAALPETERLQCAVKQRPLADRNPMPICHLGTIQSLTMTLIPCSCAGAGWHRRPRRQSRRRPKATATDSASGAARPRAYAGARSLGSMLAIQAMDSGAAAPGQRACAGAA
mmetsp:Transcript_40394/g.129666  ORF Transcript_40394/g.129666 Transcript_40394/m.129666 type:complete len:223 (+) Transcript_40394:1753-2421(+)